MAGLFCQTFFGFFTVCAAVAGSGKNLLNRRDDVRMSAPGRGAVWLAHLHGVQGVRGSNPLVPTNKYPPKGQDLTVLALCFCAAAREHMRRCITPPERASRGSGFGCAAGFPSCIPASMGLDGRRTSILLKAPGRVPTNEASSHETGR